MNGRPAAYESAALPTELHRHLVVFAEELKRDDSRTVGEMSTGGIERNDGILICNLAGI